MTNDAGPLLLPSFDSWPALSVCTVELSLLVELVWWVSVWQDVSVCWSESVEKKAFWGLVCCRSVSVVMTSARISVLLLEHHLPLSADMKTVGCQWFSCKHYIRHFVSTLSWANIIDMCPACYRTDTSYIKTALLCIYFIYLVRFFFCGDTGDSGPDLCMYSSQSPLDCCGSRTDSIVLTVLTAQVYTVLTIPVFAPTLPEVHLSSWHFRWGVHPLWLLLFDRGGSSVPIGTSFWPPQETFCTIRYEFAGVFGLVGTVGDDSILFCVVQLRSVPKQ